MFSFSSTSLLYSLKLFYSLQNLVKLCCTDTQPVSRRLGMLPAEQAAPLKLLEKGVSKEALAGLVLLEFPCELASAVLAGRWASSPTPFAPFMLGYKIRLVMAAAVTLVVRKVVLYTLICRTV